MCNKADNSCREEKLGCKGCFYNKVDDVEFIKNYIEELKMLNSSPHTLQPLNYKLEKSLSNILKQNEVLKLITTAYNAYNTGKDDDKIVLVDKRYFDCEIFKDNLISKRKIIEKINQIKNGCLVCRYQGPICDQLRKNQQCTTNEVINILKELLEEETND